MIFWWTHNKIRIQNLSGRNGGRSLYGTPERQEEWMMNILFHYDDDDDDWILG